MDLDLKKLKQALLRLNQYDPRLTRVVELHLFRGLTDCEMAETLGVPLRTAKRDWHIARVCLYNELNQ